MMHLGDIIYSTDKTCKGRITSIHDFYVREEGHLAQKTELLVTWEWIGNYHTYTHSLFLYSQLVKEEGWGWVVNKYDAKDEW